MKKGQFGEKNGKKRGKETKMGKNGRNRGKLLEMGGNGPKWGKWGQKWVKKRKNLGKE